MGVRAEVGRLPFERRDPAVVYLAIRGPYVHIRSAEDAVLGVGQERRKRVTRQLVADGVCRGEVLGEGVAEFERDEGRDHCGIQSLRPRRDA